jgi:uncharacterized protein YcbK (DUF882 family)
MGMNADFMTKVVKLRQFWNRPMTVTSAYRCAEYDAKVGKSASPGDGPHVMGRAVDVLVGGVEADEFLSIVYKLGLFTGKGFDQKLGSLLGTRYIHLDDIVADEFPGHVRPSIWNY